MRIREAVAHAGLRGEVHHLRWLVLLEHTIERRTILESCLHEGVSFLSGKPRHAGLLQRDVVIVVHVVEADYLISPRKQPLGKMVPNESGGAGNENPGHSEWLAVRAAF